jgi:NAD(P)-dependent dehydrogenase (short-subunit alcohol dehydrogenase family)
MREFEGAVAVITGGGSGIGRATALALSERGCSIAVGDKDPGRAAAVAAEVAEGGGRSVGVECDVTSDDQVAGLRDATVSELGRVDVVFSNVGIIAKGLPLEIPMDAWASVIDVNLMGTVRVLRTFLPELLAQGSGHVVTTGSTAGLFPYAYDRLPYAATKAGVVALTEALALYLRPHGIGVSCFCPSGVITNIVEQIREFGPTTPVQAPQVPIISAEEAARLVVEGIVEDRLLILSHPGAAAMAERHARDLEGFVQSQIEYLGGRS